MISRLTLSLMLFAGAIAGLQAQSVQDLVNAAGSGDTVRVPSGVWTGNVVLRTRIVLLGESGSTIRGGGEGSCVTVLADSCTVEGIAIERSGNALVHEDAGILLRSDANLVRNNRLFDILFGIYLYRSDGNVIEGNTIEGRQNLDEGERGSGVHIWDSQNNRLIGNTIRHARDGFYIQNASHTWIESNEVSDLRYGLHYMYADSNTFVGNRFHDNVAGAAVMYSHGIVMRRNEFMRNRGFTSYGILFQDCHGMTADSNLIVDNVVGMFFEASTMNRFRHNVIAQNDIALRMFQNAERNVFSENAFVDNIIPLSLVGRRTDTKWSENGRGNYWSDYDGYDLDGDGVGDVPLRIQNVFDYLEGQQPAFRLYLYSPASKALSAATKAFPILQLSAEMDDAPLMRINPWWNRVEHPVAATATSGRNSSTLAILLAAPAVGTIIIVTRRRRRA